MNLATESTDINIGVPLDYLIKTATQHYDEDVNLKIKTFVDNYKTKILE